MRSFAAPDDGIIVAKVAQAFDVAVSAPDLVPQARNSFAVGNDHFVGTRCFNSSCQW